MAGGCYCCGDDALRRDVGGCPCPVECGWWLAGLPGIDVNIPTSASSHTQTPGLSTLRRRGCAHVTEVRRVPEGVFPFYF